MSFSANSYINSIGAISLLREIGNPATNLSDIVSINKLGINQPVSSISGLLDINNLSVPSVIQLFESFSMNQLNTYDLATLISPYLNDPAVQRLSIPEFINQLKIWMLQLNLSSVDLASIYANLSNHDPSRSFVLPSISIPNGFENMSFFSMSIQASDIRYYLSTSNFLKESPLSSKSIQKINTFVNEIMEMKPELENYYTINHSYPVFTFGEILDDKTNVCLCNIRVILYQSSFYPTNSFPNALYFIVSSMDIKSITSNVLINKTFESIISLYSSIKRFMNYSSLIIYRSSLGIYSGTEFIASTQNCERFTKYINDGIFKQRFGGKSAGIYLFFNKLTPELWKNVLLPFDTNTVYDSYIFNENNPERAGISTNALYAPSTDIIASSAAYKIYQDLITKYEGRLNMQFDVNYKWNFGYKTASCHLIRLGDVTYMIGCGINIQTLVNNSIKSNGDTLLQGDVNVTSNNHNIFQINNLEKKIISSYKVGVGIENPKTTLHVNDTSMSSILEVIDQMSTNINLINKNINLLKTSNLSNLSNVIGQFIDPITNTTLIQSNFKYVSIYQLNLDFLANDQIVCYNWICGDANSPLRIFNNSPVSNMLPNLPQPVSSLPVSNQTSFLLSYFKTLLENGIMEDTMSIITVDWIFGKKHTFNRCFRNNGNLYWIGSGIDLQQYNLRYNTNDNIEQLFKCINTYQSLLNTIVSPIPTTVSQTGFIPLSQYIQPVELLKSNLTLYGNPSISQYKIYTNIKQSVIYECTNMPDYTMLTNTLESTTSLFKTVLTFDEGVVLANILDNNLFIMYQSLFSKIHSLSQKDNGIVWFEDMVQYFVSIFYCSSTGIDDNGSYFIITSIELELEKFIIPTLYVNGDSRTVGEMTTRVLYSDSNFSTIDPSRRFVGINTDEREIYYSYLPTVNKPLLYVANENDRCAVFNRIDKSGPTDPTAITVKRQFDGLFQSLQKGFGVDIGFELTNTLVDTQKIGSVGMVVDRIDGSNQNYDCYIKGGFLVTSTNIDGDVVTDQQILYVSSDGTLYTNQLVVKSNGVLQTVQNESVLTIDLGMTSMSSQTISITNNISLSYINGLENGVYRIRLVSSGNVNVSLINSSSIYNSPEQTIVVNRHLILTVTVFSNDNLNTYYCHAVNY